MKTFLLSLILLLTSVGLAQAEHSIVQQVAVVATERGSHETTTKPAAVAPAPAKYAGPTLKQIKGAFNESALVLKKGDEEKAEEREAEVNNSLGMVNGNIVILDEKLNGKKGTIKTLSNNIEELISVVKGSNTWLVISMFGVVLLALLIAFVPVGLWLRKSLPAFKRSITPDTAKLKKDIVDDIVDEVSAKINTAQNNTIGAVNSAAANVIKSVGFDTDPFCWDIEISSGKKFRVTYNFPSDWVSENKGFPRLHVPKNYTGDINTYESNPYPARRKAENDCESTMRKYLSGDFGSIDPEDADFKNEFTAQKEHIQSLEKKYQLSIREITTASSAVQFSL